MEVKAQWDTSNYCSTLCLSAWLRKIQKPLKGTLDVTSNTCEPFKEEVVIPIRQKEFLVHNSGIYVQSFPKTIPIVPLFRVWRLLSNTLETTFDGRNVWRTACLTTYLPWSPFAGLWAGAHSPSDSIGGKVLCSKRGETCSLDTHSLFPRTAVRCARSAGQCLKQEMCGQWCRLLD